MKKICILLLYFIIFQTGCSILDYDERDSLDEDLVFTGIYSQRNFLYGIYGNILRVDNYIDGAMLDCATDDAEFINDFSSIQRFNTGNVTVSYNPEDQWEYLYTGVRKCNTFLEKATIDKLDEYKNNMSREKDGDQYYPELVQALEYQRTEARFLRAYFYFELVKRYGGVPLVNDGNIDIDAGNYEVERNSMDECIAFIVSELNEVIPLLPVVHDMSFGLQGQTGRATRGTAMALKSRTLLYAASPLFNSSNNSNLWTEAAKAAHAVIVSGNYALENDYADLFLRDNSRELIFERKAGDSNSFERANYPIGYDGGNTGVCPSQNLVDAYEMQGSGLSIDDPASGYDATNPYDGRDPRFYATLLHNNSDWAGRKVETWEGGLDAPPIQNATKTGYYLKKYMNPAVRIGGGQNITQRHTLYILRLGEMYLNFAEAMNEAYGPEADPEGLGMTALEAVNRIRERANMPGFGAGMSQEAFRNRLRNERRVELAFENHRFWDVRRWKTGRETLGSDVRGVRIEKLNDSQFSYTPKIVEKRSFEEKMNLYPIPYSEVIKANLNQNPGW
ncbi:MAG: RagB/SusD family nutrient uptake outer membrane protein [Tannerella sp.]|jgi:hypothetical protein|nr:RagB/SusD family nutrient uptake outer membrane protein [Tannerella sp.]